MPPATKQKLTLAHVTHEAVEQVGGIGTVLEGLMTSPRYKDRVGRSILIGPTQTHLVADPKRRLGEHGTVLYSGIDDIDERGLGGKLRPVEWAFNVKLIYGTRTYDPPGQGRSGEAEVLLIDVFNTNKERLDSLKLRLWERFGLDSSKYEHAWDYEEYVRLAEPAVYALQAMLEEGDWPCVVFAHEFMGMPAALTAILEGDQRFRTVFHAHECATARHIVENHPGHDAMFYNVLDQAQKAATAGRASDKAATAGRASAELEERDQRSRLYVDDIFGDQSGLLRHALISRAHLCDGIIAVGDRTADEMRFLNAATADADVELVYNGLPAFKVTPKVKTASRKMLLDWCERTVGFRPDVMMTHVTRPVISKGLWRDMKLCHAMAPLLQEKGQRGVLIILTSAGGVRRPNDVKGMEKYGWPRHHRYGYPDLVGPEEGLHGMIKPFNEDHPDVQVVLVNQFGWSRERVGSAVPEGMDMADFRRGTDVELGMATYEPFGISPLEPLAAGAVCVISGACGCAGFVNAVTGEGGTRNVLIADYTRLDEPWTIEELLNMTAAERDAIEDAVTPGIAADLMSRLPRDEKDRMAVVEAGQKLVAKMGWDQVIESGLMPLLDRVSS